MAVCEARRYSCKCKYLSSRAEEYMVRINYNQTFLTHSSSHCWINKIRRSNIGNTAIQSPARGQGGHGQWVLARSVSGSRSAEETQTMRHNTSKCQPAPPWPEFRNTAGASEGLRPTASLQGTCLVEVKDWNKIFNLLYSAPSFIKCEKGVNCFWMNKMKSSKMAKFPNYRIRPIPVDKTSFQDWFCIYDMPCIFMSDKILYFHLIKHKMDILDELLTKLDRDATMWWHKTVYR